MMNAITPKMKFKTWVLILATMSFMAPTALGARQITDQAVSDAVEDQLIEDSAIRSNSLDIRTQDGIVTMTGQVDNLLTKDRAERIARTVKGVRGVIDRVRVQPSGTIRDQELRRNVNNALLMDPAAESFEIDVKAQNGKVSLDGTVDSWQEKELAATVAKGVKGVRKLDNEIKIDPRLERSDHEIKTEIEKALEWNALVDHALIDVDVNDGTVTLSGTVGSAAEKHEARIDAWVAGVMKMNDENLEVERWARDDDFRRDKYETKPDTEIRQAVKDAFLYDPRVFSFNPRVEVENGYVTLRGKVDNLKAKRAAAEDARNVVGVFGVKNRLKVRPDEIRSTEQIESDIRTALIRDPLVERFEITTDVLNGTAYLYGTVDTYFEKSQADDVASRIRGVQEVENNLVVENELMPYTYDPYVDDTYVYDYDWYTYQPGYTFKRDIDINRDIRDELWWSPFVDSDEVEVTVDDGVAILTGTVDSLSEYYSAQENALEGGATWVRNELEIQ